MVSTQKQLFSIRVIRLKEAKKPSIFSSDFPRPNNAEALINTSVSEHDLETYCPTYPIRNELIYVIVNHAVVCED